MTTIYLQTDIADSDSPSGTAQALSRHAASPVRLVNDRLIAAAPAMLKILRDLAKHHHGESIALLATIDGQTAVDYTRVCDRNECQRFPNRCDHIGIDGQPEPRA